MADDINIQWVQHFEETDDIGVLPRTRSQYVDFNRNNTVPTQPDLDGMRYTLPTGTNDVNEAMIELSDKLTENGARFNQITETNSDSSKKTCMCEWQGVTYIGTDRGQIMYYEGTTNRLRGSVVENTSSQITRTIQAIMPIKRQFYTYWLVSSCDLGAATKTFYLSVYRSVSAEIPTTTTWTPITEISASTIVGTVADRALNTSFLFRHRNEIRWLISGHNGTTGMTRLLKVDISNMTSGTITSSIVTNQVGNTLNAIITNSYGTSDSFSPYEPSILLVLIGFVSGTTVTGLWTAPFSGGNSVTNGMFQVGDLWYSVGSNDSVICYDEPTGRYYYLRGSTSPNNLSVWYTTNLRDENVTSHEVIGIPPSTKVLQDPGSLFAPLGNGYFIKQTNILGATTVGIGTDTLVSSGDIRQCKFAATVDAVGGSAYGNVKFFVTDDKVFAFGMVANSSGEYPSYVSKLNGGSNTWWT